MIGEASSSKGSALPPERRARGGQLVVHDPQRLAVLGSNRAGDEQNARVARALHPGHPRIERKVFDALEGVAADGGEHRDGCAGGESGERPYCHRNTPSRQA